MKKMILCVAAIAIVSLSATAQKEAASSTFKIGAGVNVGLPIGDLSDYSSLVIGADLLAEYAAAESASVTLSAGYLNFTGKNGAGSSGLIPVLLGGKFKFSDQIYGHAQVGMSFSTESGGGSAFTYAPSIGYVASENVDISIKYQAATKDGFTTSFIGLRAGFTF